MDFLGNKRKSSPTVHVNLLPKREKKERNTVVFGNLYEHIWSSNRE